MALLGELATPRDCAHPLLCWGGCQPRGAFVMIRQGMGPGRIHRAFAVLQRYIRRRGLTRRRELDVREDYDVKRFNEFGYGWMHLRWYCPSQVITASGRSAHQFSTAGSLPPGKCRYCCLIVVARAMGAAVGVVRRRP